MKSKTWYFGLAAVSVAAVAALFVSINGSSYSEMMATDVEALTYTECLNDVGNNTGRCARKVDGTGSSCVEKGWFTSADCTGETGV